MTPPDFREKAAQIIADWQANPGMAGEPDLSTRITCALESAYRRGRVDQIDESIELIGKCSHDECYRRLYGRRIKLEKEDQGTQ